MNLKNSDAGGEYELFLEGCKIDNLKGLNSLSIFVRSLRLPNTSQDWTYRQMAGRRVLEAETIHARTRLVWRGKGDRRGTNSGLEWCWKEGKTANRLNGKYSLLEKEATRML
jgi:hypothetical protein